MKVKKILYHRLLSLDQFRFCETQFTTYPRFVANKSAISPFLGGGCGRNIERGIVAVVMLRWLIEFVIFKWVTECVVFRWLIDFGVCDVARGLVAVVILRWLVEFVRRRRLKEFVIFRWLTIWVSTIAWLKDESSHKLSHLQASHELWKYEWHVRNFVRNTFGMSEILWFLTCQTYPCMLNNLHYGTGLIDMWDILHLKKECQWVTNSGNPLAFRIASDKNSDMPNTPRTKHTLWNMTHWYVGHIVFLKIGIVDL